MNAYHTQAFCNGAFRAVAAVSSDDFEVRHHRHVFVLEIVAVEDVAALKAVKANDDPRDPAGAEIERVLPPTVSRPRTATLRQHLERRKVQVYRVGDVR